MGEMVYRTGEGNELDRGWDEQKKEGKRGGGLVLVICMILECL